MKTKIVSALAAALTLCMAASAFATFYVYPANVSPTGKTYSTMAADWWKWALAQPANKSPVLDTTGANCAQGQPGFGVWYLAGSNSSTPVTRDCTIPSGRTLIFPILNAAYFAFPTDPANEKTESFIRGQVTFVEQATNLALEIDGVSVPNIASHLEKSDIFSFTLGANNYLNLPAGQVLSPSVDEGYYVTVAPLYGNHTVHFHGKVGEFTQDITYTLHIH